MKAFKYLALGLLMTTGFSSCSSDYLETEDHEYLDSETAGVAAGHNPAVFLNGMWSFMVDTYNSSHDSFNYMASLHAMDLMGEDMVMAGSAHFIYDYQHDNRMWDYRRVNVYWSTFYTLISKANEIIGLYPNGASTDGEKALLGQAKAIRGYSYNCLIQLFRNYVNADGTINMEQKGLPILLTEADGYSSEELAAMKGVNTVKAVFEQAGKDLEEGATLLDSANYVRENKDYIDANVAYGLLARYYLTTQQWDKAANAANKARKGYKPMDEAGLHDGFYDLKNKEWMWGFDHSTETSTVYASFFSMISNLTPGYAGLGYAPKLIDARLYSMIPADDYRKTQFNGADGDSSQPTAAAQRPYANVKFGTDGNWTMDYVYMRAAEMYLIEAEALVRQDKNTEAATVLKELMTYRQPSWNKTSVTLNDVLLQRRIELWGEGFNYFDLKRNNLGIDRAYEGSNHMTKIVVPAQDVRWTYQIPQTEFNENKLLNVDEDQNP